VNRILIILACVAVSVAIGIGLAWKPDEQEQSSTQGSTSASQKAQAAAGQSDTSNSFSSIWGTTGSAPIAPEKKVIIEDLWARAMTPADKLRAGDDAPDKLRKLAQSDPEVLKSLLGRYSKENSPEAKELLKSILSTIDSPDVLAFSKQLATSGSADQRKDGLAMLQSISADSQEVRSIIKQTLATEQTPGVIVQALAALKPSTKIDPAESEAIVAQLKNLTQNADASVRSQSVLQLAQWDKSGAAQSNFSQALADPAPEVRQSAIFAIAQSGTQSDGAKTALFNMISNANESKDVKGSALQVLERFTLTQEEAAKYSQLRTQIMGQ
jgi:hypothetical protein